MCGTKVPSRRKLRDMIWVTQYTHCRAMLSCTVMNVCLLLWRPVWCVCENVTCL